MSDEPLVREREPIERARGRWAAHAGGLERSKRANWKHGY